MRKTAMVLAVVLAVVMMVGCSSVPEWVQKGSGAFPGDRGKACYGVGLAGPDLNPRLQRDQGRANARMELARSIKLYAAELIKDFMQKHKDWVDPKDAGSIEFYQEASKQVTEATLYGSQEINTWYDSGGKRGVKGTLYVLMVLPLDNQFFDAAQKKYDALMREYQARLFKNKTDQALKELDEELKKARQDPLGLTGPLTVPPGEGKAK